MILSLYGPSRLSLGLISLCWFDCLPPVFRALTDLSSSLGILHSCWGADSAVLNIYIPTMSIVRLKFTDSNGFIETLPRFDKKKSIS